VQAGDRVAVLALTRPALEAHFGLMRIGAILVMLNTRLASAELEWIRTIAALKSCWWTRSSNADRQRRRSACDRRLRGFLGRSAQPASGSGTCLR
jgi:acyl-CoA synthetase (AMP-forming)/AMP-acid ligase II